MTSICKTLAVIVVFTALSPRSAHAQEIVISPPSAYIATSEPEYFEGRPVYYYNNSWYYRDHGRWSYYHSEPEYLRDRRAHWGGGGYERGYQRGNERGYQRGNERGYQRGNERGYQQRGNARGYQRGNTSGNRYHYRR